MPPRWSAKGSGVVWVLSVSFSLLTVGSQMHGSVFIPERPRLEPIGTLVTESLTCEVRDVSGGPSHVALARSASTAAYCKSSESFCAPWLSSFQPKVKY